ncbi:restriction endonuclease subunit S [Cupriavidus necator]
MKLNDGFEWLATAPGGVARLRELILSLAVRGRLVPQVLSDESARRQLAGIADSKNSLINLGKIRSDKPLPDIPDEERSFQLPESWEWVRLGTVSKRVQYGYTASARGDIPHPKFVRITDIQDGRVNWHTVPGVDAAKEDVESYYLEAGDILIARTGGTIGKSFLVGDVPTQAIFASYLIRISPLGILPRYLKAYLSSDVYWDQLYANSMGTGQPNVNGTALARLIVPCPPIAEQDRIVAKVDELMLLCDGLEARARLEAEQHARLTATLFEALAASESSHALAENWSRVATNFDLLLDRPEAVDALEQTIVQLAMRGLLVPQIPGEESASDLLQDIRQEKDRLIANGKIRRDKPLSKIDEEDLPFEVPDGWIWTRLGAAVLDSEAGWSPSCENTPRAPGSWGVLKVSAVSWGQFRPHENKALPTHLVPKPEYEVQPGDFLLSRANTEELVARSVLVDMHEPMLMMSDKLIRLRLSTLINPQYLNLFNNSRVARPYYAAHASGTSSSMKNVSREVVLNLPVAMPPAAEQARIVTRVAELRQLCTDLRMRLTQRQTCQANFAEALVAQTAAAGPDVSSLELAA